eukprot:2421045-Lingulodinium_polyedra.AAC.1
MAAAPVPLAKGWSKVVSSRVCGSKNSKAIKGSLPAGRGQDSEGGTASRVSGPEPRPAGGRGASGSDGPSEGRMPEQ